MWSSQERCSFPGYSSSGTHKGKIRTIHKANLVKHGYIVLFNDDTGFIQRWSYCIFLETGPTGTPVRGHQDRIFQSRRSRLSSSFLDTSPAPHPLTASVPNLSDTSTAGNSSSVKSRHWSEVTMDLLTHSIAIMRLVDAHVDEWTQQLCARITYFRQGHT
jgi:hypothetical protein